MCLFLQNEIVALDVVFQRLIDQGFYNSLYCLLIVWAMSKGEMV